MYFDCVHPRFPFLDRVAFEHTAFNQDKPHSAPKSKAWNCLFHTVLALGCQYDGGGGFEPGVGESWKLFSIALAGFTELMLLPDTLTTFQAVTTMVIYSLGVSGIAFEHVFMLEATRRAQNLADARFVGPAAEAYRKTFWALYTLEKITSFHHGRTSVSIPLKSSQFFFSSFLFFYKKNLLLFAYSASSSG